MITRTDLASASYMFTRLIPICLIDPLGGSETEKVFIMETYGSGNRRYRFYYILEDGKTIHFMPGYYIDDSDGSQIKLNTCAVPLKIFGYRFK